VPDASDPRREAVIALKRANPESGTRRIRDVLKRFEALPISGRTERELAKLNPNLFCFRPAVIKPSRRGEKMPLGAALFTPVAWVVDR
jgi:hypothetical protein